MKGYGYFKCWPVGVLWVLVMGRRAVPGERLEENAAPLPRGLWHFYFWSSAFGVETELLGEFGFVGLGSFSFDSMEKGDGQGL